MAPPLNLTPETAQDLGTLPFTVVEDVSEAPDQNAVWFRYTHRIAAPVVGFAALAPAASTYQPLTTWYATLADAVNNGNTYLSFLNTMNVPLQVPVRQGQTYYILVQAQAAIVPDAPLTITGVAPPMRDAPVGAILVNDDSQNDMANSGDAIGYPLAVISPVDGTVLQFRNAPGLPYWPPGEAAVMLPSGISCWNDRSYGGVVTTFNGFRIYGPPPARATDDFVQLAAFTIPPPNLSIPAMTTNYVDAFYIGFTGDNGDPSSFSTVTHVTIAGGLGARYTVPIYDLFGMGVSPDETILYYNNYDVDIFSNLPTPIQRWDLVHNSALPDFRAGFSVGGQRVYVGRDLLVLPDGSLIVIYVGTTYTHVVRFAADGSTIWDKDDTNLGAYLHGIGDRMQRDVDAATFWIFTNTHALSQYVQVRSSDGAILRTLHQPPQFEQGIYAGQPGDVLAQSFGNSNSCTITPLTQPLISETPHTPACPVGLPLLPTAARPACAASLPPA